MVEAKIDTDKKIFFVVVLLLLVFGIGKTYAYFSAKSNTSTETVTTATYDLKVDNNAILRAENIVPIASSDITTKATELGFTITNKGTGSMNTKISLTNITMSEGLKVADFKWGLYSDDTKIVDGNFLNTGDSIELANNIVIDKDEVKNYKLYIWIEDTGNPQNTLQSSSFEGKITVDAVQI